MFSIDFSAKENYFSATTLTRLFFSLIFSSDRPAGKLPSPQQEIQLLENGKSVFKGKEERLIKSFHSTSANTSMKIF